MAKKLTIVEQFNSIIAKAKKGEPLTAEEIAFLKERADLATKKNANRKPTKEQEANEVLKGDILNAMENGKKYTITDLMKSVSSCSGLANQKISALVRQLKDDKLVTRTEEKGKAYFEKN